MGQVTMAVMVAVDAGVAPDHLGDEGWSALLSEYKYDTGQIPDRPCKDMDKWNLIGFLVAVGGSKKNGYPGLDKLFPLDNFLSVHEYNMSCVRAKNEWGKFSAWAAMKGYTFNKPGLWLVQIEVG